jgi:hypothetical protein
MAEFHAFSLVRKTQVEALQVALVGIVASRHAGSSIGSDRLPKSVG